jgi:hypothetical protein
MEYIRNIFSIEHFYLFSSNIYFLNIICSCNIWVVHATMVGHVLCDSIATDRAH